MEGYKVIAIVGVVILVIGVFVPVPLQGLQQSISYFASQPTAGGLIFALAVLALLFTYTGDSTRLFLLSVLTLIVVGWPYIRNPSSLPSVGASMNNLTNSVTSSVAETVAFTTSSVQPIRGALFSMGDNFPWFVMLAGGALLVIAGLVAPRQH